MPQLFSENSNYRSEIRAILRLHQLWLDGKGESAEADALRDAPDGPWRLLSDAERKRVWGLSQDLNSMSEPRNLEATEMNPQAQAKLVEAYEARQQGEWDRALDILRQWGKHFPPPCSRTFGACFGPKLAMAKHQSFFSSTPRALSQAMATTGPHGWM